MTSSIVITAFNRAGHLRRCLPTLLKQKVKADEVIVIDDGSQDNTRESVEGIINQYPEWNIRYIYNNRSEYLSCCLPKNIGIKQSVGDIVIFTEPEMLHIGNTIEKHLEWHKKRDDVFVSAGVIYFVFGGVVTNMSLENWENPETITKMPNINEWEGDYQPKAEDIAVQRLSQAPYISSVRREHLMRVRGFEERMDRWGFDDVNLICRLNQVGVKCISDPNIQAVHIAHGYNYCFEWFDYSQKLHDKYSQKPEANDNKEWGIIKK